MGAVREHWERLVPAAEGLYEAWEQRVFAAAEVLSLLGSPLSEEIVEQKLQLWGGPAASPQSAPQCLPTCARPPGVPAFYRVTHAAGVAVRSNPSLDAEVVGHKCSGEVVAALGPQDMRYSESDAPGWICLVEPDGPGFMLCDGRAAGIGHSLLHLLTAGEEEALVALHRDIGRQIRRAELLVLCQLHAVTPACRFVGRLPRVCDGLPLERRDGVLWRPVALNAELGLVAVRGSGEVCQSPWRILACRALRQGDLVEACRMAPLEGPVGKALARVAVTLDGGRLGVPLGYGPLYRNATPENLAGSAEPSANCKASLVPWSDGTAADCVLLIRTTEDVHPGEELVLHCPGAAGIVPSCPAAWNSSLDEPAVRSCPPAGNYGEATSGFVWWSRSEVHGAGVFSSRDLVRGSVLELCPALVLDELSSRAAADYSMGFRPLCASDVPLAVLPLGMGSLYNHGLVGEPSADYWYDSLLEAVVIVANQDIAAGQEVFVDYGRSYWDNRALGASARCDSPPAMVGQPA
mmetsp:Transcript_9566/g.28244  ORF Transcript_9566/g.28244 Transcript_9566/m.28244 type:complete len:521 (+) Transcript_9566:204-1766(+)